MIAVVIKVLLFQYTFGSLKGKSKVSNNKYFFEQYLGEFLSSD